MSSSNSITISVPTIEVTYIPLSRGYHIRKETAHNKTYDLFLEHKKCGKDVYDWNGTGIKCYSCFTKPSQKILNKCQFLNVIMD